MIEQQEVSEPLVADIAPRAATVSRVHRSWLAARERMLLTRLAARMPRAITPDHLTLFGLCGALLCGVSYAMTAFSPRFLLLASLGLLINWFGDSLDGSLARYRAIERPQYGFFIDHTTDLLAQLCIFFGLGASPYMRFDMACVMLLSYWMASLYTFIRAVAVRVFQISYFGIGPTEIRLGLIAYNFLLLIAGPLTMATPLGRFSLIDLFSVVIFIAVFLSLMLMVANEGRRLAAIGERPAVLAAPAARASAAFSSVAFATTELATSALHGPILANPAMPLDSGAAR
jgi:phosphatidylglycerophosphate synthase